MRHASALSPAGAQSGGRPALRLWGIAFAAAVMTMVPFDRRASPAPEAALGGGGEPASECTRGHLDPFAPDERFRASDLAIGPDGFLFVSEPDSGRVVVLDPGSGRRSRSLDAVPRPLRVGWMEGVPYALGEDGGFATFDPRGRVLDIGQVRPPNVASPFTAGWPLALVPGGRAIHRVTAPVLAVTSGTVSERPIVLADLDGVIEDTLLVIPTEREAYHAFLSETSRSVGAQPFADHPLFAVAPGGDWVVTVHRAPEDVGRLAAYRVRRWTLEGDTIFSVTVPTSPIPIEPDAVDAAIGRILGHRASDPQAVGAVRDVLFVPEAYPPVTRVVAAVDGSVWIAREDVHGQATRRWDVIDPTGRRVACIEVPADISIRAARERTAWAWEHVGERRFRIWRIRLDTDPARL